jgi:vanillate O-demethylase ferredoxin subunit
MTSVLLFVKRRCPAGTIRAGRASKNVRRRAPAARLATGQEGDPVLQDITHPEMNVNPAATRLLRVVARQRETDDIVTFDLADPAGLELPPFTPGAHIDIELGPDLIRQYSLLNDPAERRRYQVGILKDPNSRGGSIAMHAIREGDFVPVTGPRNHFPLHPAPHFALLLAGGIGITPLLSMARQRHREGRNFALHYCARSAAQAAFLPTLRTCGFAESVTLHFDNEGEAQRLDLAALLAAAPADTHLYICGPGGFMAWCLETAAAAGFADERLHREYFKAAEPAVTVRESAFQVKLASSGKVMDIPANASILNVLRANGVNLPASCESGVCGTCLTGVISGTPDHRDFYLTKQERAAGDVIMPCCSRAASPLLVLDI